MEWKDLSAFLRYSNISSADFDVVRKRYIDYYEDKIARTHPCLVTFGALSQEEIDKDRVIVEKFVKDYKG